MSSDLTGSQGLSSVIRTPCCSFFLSALDSAVLCVSRLPACGGQGDCPQLQTYVALTSASLLRRSVSVDTFSTSPVLTPESQWSAVDGFIFSVPVTSCRGIVYSVQTWVRNGQPWVRIHPNCMLSERHMVVPQKDACR